MIAASAGYTEVMNVLLEFGADVNASDNDGTTALIWATRAEEIKAIKILLKADANAEAENEYGATALSEALFNRNMKAVRLLEKYM